MKAAIYVRISQDMTGKAAGVRRQEKECRDLAEARGWEVTVVHRDNDTSASSGRRRLGYDALMDDLRAGRVKAVVVWHPDRLYRRPIELEGLITLIEDRDVKIATVTAGEIDLVTASGRMTARVIVAVAKAEVERAGERQRARWRQRHEDGALLNLGRRPFGYARDGDRLVIVKPEADELKKAARRIIAGETVYRICQDWIAAGIKTPNCTCRHGSGMHTRGVCTKCRDKATTDEERAAARHRFAGALWRPSALKRTLTANVLTGGNKWPPILTDDEHAILLAKFPPAKRHARHDPVPGEMLDSLGRLKHGGRPAGRRYPLSQLLLCGRCGEKMAGSSGAYHCDVCGKIGIKATPVEMHVMMQTAFWIGSLDATAQAAPTVDTEPIMAELRSIEAKVAEVQEDYADDKLDRAGRDRIMSRLDARRATAVAKLGASVPTPAAPRTKAEWLADVGTMRQRWRDRKLTDAENAQLREYIEAYVAKVVVKPVGKNTGGKFDPRRVVVTFKKTA